MIFSSEVARALFHRLPIDRQLSYTRLAQSLAAEGKLLCIASVMIADGQLECGIRINEKFELDSSAAGS